MTPAPRVSVIVIFLDEVELLGEAIASVQAQTFTDWELLLCDDGSSDGSERIARDAAAADPRIHHLQHPGGVNRGMSATRNLGARAARGELLALLDADDTWMPEKLVVQVGLLDDHPRAAMVCGASLYWRSWAPGAAEGDVVVPVGAEPGLHEPPSLSLRLYPLGPGAAPCPSDIVVRRSIVEAVGGFEEHFTGSRQLYEDQGFLAKVYLRHPVYVFAGCLSRYRQRPDSCVATVTAGGDYDAVRRYFLDWLDRHVAASPDLAGHDVGAVRRAIDVARDPAPELRVRPWLRRLRRWARAVPRP